MDNLCHTLAGAALAHAGLKRAAPFGTATLIVAANLPDVDVLSFAGEMPWVAFRRGWTHGVLAQAVLSVALAGLVFALARRRGARFGSLLLLSYVGVLSHIALDLLNNYGVRLLMPFSGRWFYGDSVFIVDIWLWLVLGAGVWFAFTRDDHSPARVALIAATAYIAAMVGSAVLARDMVRDEWRARHGGAPRALMVGPMPFTPFRRAVIVDAGHEYATGVFSWFSLGATFDAGRVAKNEDDPIVRTAVAADPRMRAVLTWARFPFYRVESTPGGDVVTLRDLRFGDRVGPVSTTIARR